MSLISSVEFPSCIVNETRTWSPEKGKPINYARIGYMGGAVQCELAAGVALQQGLRGIAKGHVEVTSKGAIKIVIDGFTASK